MAIPDFLVPGDTEADNSLNRLFWNKIYTDMFINKDYSQLTTLLQQLLDTTLAIIPSRKDLHDEIKESIDIPFIIQRLSNNAFSQEDFLALINYWVDWAKKLGAPADDKKMDDLLRLVLEETEEKGYSYMLPYAYDRLYIHIMEIYHAAQKIKLSLKN